MYTAHIDRGKTKKEAFIGKMRPLLILSKSTITVRQWFIVNTNVSTDFLDFRFHLFLDI